MRGVNFARGPDFHVGLYAGYHFLRETVSAFGCGQVATNPEICGGGIPDFVKVITQVNNWNSVRVGIDAAYEINRFKLAVDAAWLPYVYLDRVGCTLASHQSAGCRRLQRSDPRGWDRLGLSARKLPVLSRQRLRSASASAAAIGTWKRPA